MKLCTRCRHRRFQWDQLLLWMLDSSLFPLLCGHERSIQRSKPSPIDGSVKVQRFPCHYMRSSTEPCGPEGKLWEPMRWWPVK